VQVPFFVDRGIPESRVRVTPLGVDTHFFCPDHAPRKIEAPLRGLIMGSTERDHAFMASVMRMLPSGLMELCVRTDLVNERFYEGVPGVRMLPALSDETIVEAYRSADLLLMPMTDCTANNAILEAMACGTPVMANRIGGIPEYVDATSCFITEGKVLEDWVERIKQLARSREDLASRRAAVRAWGERFDWDHMAVHFRNLYRDALGQGS
jgi:glycosyltransferase involved in cell wall biosynthesis